MNITKDVTLYPLLHIDCHITFIYISDFPRKGTYSLKKNSLLFPKQCEIELQGKFIQKSRNKYIFIDYNRRRLDKTLIWHYPNYFLWYTIRQITHTLFMAHSELFKLIVRGITMRYVINSPTWCIMVLLLKPIYYSNFKMLVGQNPYILGLFNFLLETE